ncbi:MAG: acyl-CoA reductase [Flavobacteriales bacterium]|nr:acyl-CoA reductase [Flavobacteriales bacterium]
MGAKAAMQGAMLTLDARVAALAQLGTVMQAIGRSEAWPGHTIGLGEAEYDSLQESVRRAHIQNGWATEENVRHAFAAWGEALNRARIEGWVAAYPELSSARTDPRTVGLILAGNIPLVGLHDVLCVWLSGHHARVKCSSQETELVPAVFTVLDHFAPGALEQISFTTEKLGAVDALIATGSNNTARYFEHYFGHVPRIVRKSRVSVAVLDGTETEAELTALGEDVFRYFGLGCRNVSKVLVPQDFDLDRLFKAFFPWKDIVHHNKYANNYDYTRALWMLDRIDFVENGFLLVKEDAALTSPVATLFYERYDDVSTAKAYIAAYRDSIQCIVGHGDRAFGRSQYPELADYADGVDTLRFLLGLK